VSALYAALCDMADAYDEREEARAEAIAERRHLARMNHWCRDCLGFTGPGSPCAIEEDEPEDEPEDDSEFCQGCNPEPTVEELECGVCASCGKELLG
jgi:hypothetical protein